MVKRGSLVLALLCLFAHAVQAATFSAHVDRKSMTQGETLILELTLADSDTRLRAEGEQPNIDLTLLSRDFELGVPREHHRFNIQRNRGRATSTLHVELFPRHTGELSIPAFAVDGLRSRPITIRVLKEAPEHARELFVRTGVVKKRLWVGETTLLYLDLYHRVEIESARLGGLPDTEPKNIDLERIGSRDRTETINGLEYQVSRTAWGLAPRQLGVIKIHMPDVWVVTRAGDKKRLPFSDVEITAKALPADIPTGVIVGHPKLVFDTSEGPLTTGSPHAAHLTIRADTLPQLMPSRPPDLDFPAGLKVYSEMPRIEGPEFDIDGHFATTARYPMQVLPSQSGRYQLPEITLPYFDTDKGGLAIATLQGPTLNIIDGGAEAGDTASMATQSGEASRSFGGRDEVQTWQSISLGLGLLWIGTLLIVLRRSRKRPQAQPGSPPSKPSRGTPADRLLAAMGTRTLEAGLRRWEELFGVDAARTAIVRAVQQARYGGDDTQEEKASHRAVDEVLAEIPRSPSTRDRQDPDPWRPESFTPVDRLRR